MKFSEWLIEEQEFYEEFLSEKNIIKRISDLTKDLIGKKVKFKIDKHKNGKGIGNIKDIQTLNTAKKILKLVTPNGDEEWFTLTPNNRFGIQLV